jgi:hypothetical protein
MASLIAKKYHDNDNDAKLNKEDFLDENARKEMNESLKNFTIKLPETHKNLP